MAKLLRIVLLKLTMAGLVLTSLGQPDTLPQEVVKGSSEAANLIVQGKALLNSEPDRCLDIGLQALVAAKNDGDSFSEALALELLAEANYRLGEYETSHRYYNRATNLYTSINKPEYAAKSLLGMVKANESAQNIDLAIQQLEAGIRTLKEIQDKEIYVEMLIKLGNLHLSQENFKRAIQYGSEALTLISSQKVTAYNKNKTLITILNLLGQASKNSGDLRTSLDYFKKASEAAVKLSDSVLYSKMLNEIGGVFMLTQKYDSAFQYFNLSYIISNNASDTIGITQSLQGLGDYYFEKGNYNQAINYYTQCNNIAVKHNDIPTTITALVNISLCHFQLNDYPTSSHFLNQALTIAQKNNLSSSKADVYRYLSVINEAQGRYKDALNYHKMWVELRDSLQYEETGQRLAKLQILYEISQKEKENEILKQNSEIQKLQIAKSKYQMQFLISLLVIIAIILLLLVILFRNKQKEIAKQKETEQRITEINRELERRMIEEIKKQEKQQQLLSQKSKLESMGTLAAGIAHEINQPLGGISMGLDNLLMRIQDNNYNEEYLKEKLNSLFENVERIKKIIDHIRYFSRTQKPVTFSTVNINDVVKSALFMVSAQYENHGVTIETSLDENLPNITADKYKLEQVLLNLLSNAKDALQEKEKKSNDNTYWKKIKVSTSKDEQNVYLSVWDNGTGIPQKVVEKIFDPFFTTKSEDKGTGLGLSISYGFIKDILGDIRVESEPNEYTLFEITIPKD